MAQKFHSDLKFLGSNNIEISGGIIDNLTGDLVIQNSVDDSDIIFKSDDINLGSGTPTEYFRLDGSTRKVEYSVPLHSTSSAHFEAESGVGIYGGGYGTFSISNSDDSYHTVFGYDGGAFSYIDGQIVLLDYGSGNETTGTAAYNLAVTSDGTLIEVTTGDFETAERTEILVKNVEGSSLVKGDPIYIVGGVGASARLEVGLCDASDSSKMPCVGLLSQNLANNGEGLAIVTGKLRNLVTSPIDGVTPTENDTIYVKPGGSSGAALTTTKPTANNHLIQNVGQVGLVSTTASGNLVVSAIMRTNDVPNQIDRNINFTDNSKLTFGDSTTPDLEIYHNGSNSFITDSGTGALIISSNFLTLSNAADTEYMAKLVENAQVELYYDGSKKLETTSSGVKVTSEGYQINIEDGSSGNISEILTSNTAMGFFADRANAVSGTSMIFSVDNTTALTIDDSQNSTFAGDIITTDGLLDLNISSEGKYFEGGSGNLRKLSITSGTNISAHALHTFNIASSNGKYEFDVNGTTEFSLDSSNATFSGRVDIEDDLRIRGAGGNPSQGVVRFYTDSTNKLNIDTGNSGTNLTTIDSSGNATFAGNIYANADIIFGGDDTYNATINYIDNGAGDHYLVFQTQHGGTTDDTLKLHAGTKLATFAGDISSRHIVPTTDSTYDLGNTTNYWRTLYADNIISNGGDAEFQKVYKDTVTINESTYTTVATVGGNSLASAIRLNVSGVSSSTVINVDAKILVNHYRDILIKSTCAYYRRLYIKITSDNNEDFAIELKKDSGGNSSQSVNIEIIPLNSEEITITNSHSISGTTHEHLTEYGESQSSNDADGGHDYHYWLKDDGAKLKLGGSSDLELYHDGSNSYIRDNGTGRMRFMASTQYDFLNGAGNETLANFIENGAVKLYYDNSLKFETTNTGINVTGDVKATNFYSVENTSDGGFTLPRDYAKIGSGSQAGGLIINDISGARHAITGGGYDLSFYKETDNGSGTLAQDLYMRVNATNAASSVSDIEIFKTLKVTSLLEVGGDGHLFLGGDNQTPKIDMMFDDHASGAGWDTRIFIGKTDDLPNGASFPTSEPAGGFGIQFQGNSDGAFFGIEKYSTTNYRPVINWGDDSTDSPFRFKFNNGEILNITKDGKITGDGVHLMDRFKPFSDSGSEWIGSSSSTLELSGTNINLNGASGSGTPVLKHGGTTIMDTLRNMSNIRNIIPETTNTYTLGNTTTYWNNVIARAISTTGDGDRTKIRVWSGSTYGIGMKSGYSYGHIANGEFCMSFQMNNNNGRGFWWGDDNHTDAQGAMSLSTNGRLTVATSISVGEGQSVTSPSSVALNVSGTGTAGAATLKINNSSSSAFNHSLEAFAANLTNAESNILVVGKEGNTRNSGYIGYYWVGHQSTDNYITLGHWGVDHIMKIYGSGDIHLNSYAYAQSNVNSTGDAGLNIAGNRLGFDQSGTRSWTMKATGGFLNVYSGDSLSAFNLAGHLNLRINGGGIAYPNSSNINIGATGWRRLGRWQTAQGGRQLVLHIAGGVGYNASLGQQGEITIILRTSNASSSQTATSGSDAIYLSGYYYQTGYTALANTNIRVVQVNTSTYDVYMQVKNFLGECPLIAHTGTGSEFYAYMDTTGNTFSGVSYLDLLQQQKFLSEVIFDDLNVNNSLGFVAGSSIPSAAISYHTNGFIYVKGGGGGVAIGDDGFNTSIYCNDASSIEFNTNSSLAGEIKSNHAVEFQKMLSIRGGSTDATMLATYNNATVASANLGTYINQYAFLDLASSNANGSWIDFSYADGNDFGGRIRYVNGSNYFAFYTSATERARILSGGDFSLNNGLYINCGLGTVSGTQVAIVKENESTNLQRWGSATTGTQSYRIRIDQNFDFIGNNGGLDRFHLSADEGDAYFLGTVLVGTSSSDGGKLQVRESATTGSIRIGGGNGAGNSRLYIQSQGDNSYIDSYGGNAYQNLGIQAASLKLCTASGTGEVSIATTQTTEKLNLGGNMKIYPSSSSWAEGLSFSMPTQAVWGGIRWRRERSGHDGNHYIGYVGNYTNDDLVFGSNTGGTQKDYNLAINKDGRVTFGTTTFDANSQVTMYSEKLYGLTVLHNKDNSSTTFADALFLQNINNNNANQCRIGMSTNGSDGQHHRVTLAAERDTSASYRGEFSIHVRQSDGTNPKKLRLDYNGNLTVSGDVIAYGSPSDKRLKENIKPINNALDTVQKLQGVTFDWKESKSLLDIKNDIGFIAQDVKEVLPELVRENEDGQMSLRDKGIVPVLVEAIKELKAEIEELKKQIK